MPLISSMKPTLPDDTKSNMLDATTMVLPYNRSIHVGSNKNVTRIDLVATILLDPVATNKLLATCMLVGSDMFEAN